MVGCRCGFDAIATGRLLILGLFLSCRLLWMHELMCVVRDLMFQAAYREANGGKRPGREELLSDPDARNAFLEFSRLNRRERVDLKFDKKALSQFPN